MGIRDDVQMRVAHTLLATAGRVALARFRRRLPRAGALNARALRDVLALNGGTDFGRRYGLASVLRAGPELPAAYRAAVPLMTYDDLLPYVRRVELGEANVLTADPVTMLGGSAGTTGEPKRIPRTARVHDQHFQLAVLAEHGVVVAGIPGAAEARRGISLMSSRGPRSPEGAAPGPAVVAGPQAGMARLGRLMHWLYCSPAPVFAVRDATTSLYLHALFGLRDAGALFIKTPFAPQVTAWLEFCNHQLDELVRDLADGTLARGLALSAAERDAIGRYLHPAPNRARFVAGQFAQGLEAIIPRLWPRMAYVRTVTSGAFALSLPRLRWLAGPNLPIQSGCHASSEGLLGLNLRTDGAALYTLAVGAGYFEFLPTRFAKGALETLDCLEDLQVGPDYELVLTGSAGLYRYRLGDVVRIVGWDHAAPVFEFLYRRGTLLNLVGEKTTEAHTSAALVSAMQRHGNLVLRDYTVAGAMEAGIGRYTFYLELSGQDVLPADLPRLAAAVDEALGAANPYYRDSGREARRLERPRLCLVRRGSFEELLGRRAGGGDAGTQVKTARRVTSPAQREFLEANTVLRSA
jgi:hypothetical protein